MKKIDKERKTIVEPLHEDIDGQEFDVVVAAVNKAKEAHKYDRIWFEVASHDDTDIVGEQKESDDEYEKRIGAIKKKEKVRG